MCSILTLTLNPAIDFNVILSETLLKGRVNRAERAFKVAGGKGINVASFLADMGLKNICVTGFLGMENADCFREHFVKKGLCDEFIYFHGATRENIKILENKGSTTTDINLESSYEELPLIKELKRVVNNFINKSEYYIFSGSVPKWLDESIYYEVGKYLKDFNKKIIIDTSGVPLKKALNLHPFAIKPNIDEFYELFGGKLDFSGLLKNIDVLIESGIEYVLLSMGENGAIIANKDLKLKVVGKLSCGGSSVGAGDAFLAGFVYGSIKNFNLQDLAVFSTASSLALIESNERILPDAETIIDNYYKNITLEDIKTK
jgi:1-phosphofructokinase